MKCLLFPPSGTSANSHRAGGGCEPWDAHPVKEGDRGWGQSAGQRRRLIHQLAALRRRLLGRLHQHGHLAGAAAGRPHGRTGVPTARPAAPTAAAGTRKY